MAMTLAALERELGAARVRRTRGPSREALTNRQRIRAGIPAYLSDFRLVPGSCAKRRCRSRYGVVRLSIDMTSRERCETLATIECADCGRTWRRIRAPRLTEYQRTRLTLILPGDQRRWYSRGHWHTEGHDAFVIRDATQLELMAAQDDWRTRNAQYLDAKSRAKRRREDAEREQHAHAADLLARLAAMDAARAAEEAAATDRED